MKWVAISSSRITSPELEKDVEREMNRILDNGNGIITGGALGVDYLATDIVLKRFPDGSRVQVILPTALETYTRHYRRRVNEGVITKEQADALISQLAKLQTLHSLIENPTVHEVNTASYYARNSAVVDASGELLAFHVNGSPGTKDTISKPGQKNIPVRAFHYHIPT